jgi:hypothetical protein
VEDEANTGLTGDDWIEETQICLVAMGNKVADQQYSIPLSHIDP